MLQLFNDILHGEQPSHSMRTSVVQFLSKPKKADSIKLSDRRKISVLCTDFKCLETIIANRLNTIMPKFISQSQYAARPRKIHQGISEARDVINYISKKDIPAAFLCLDMKAGFDNLNLDFTWFCLLKYGFSTQSINIMKNLYSCPQALSYINGSVSNIFQDMTGNLRQGGSASMQIFVISVHPLLQLLENKLKGVTMYSIPVAGPVLENQVSLKPLSRVQKQVAYVDDINPLLTSVDEFHVLDKCLMLFEYSSGCQFQRDHISQKCKAMPLGPWKQWLTQETIPLPFLLVSDYADVLGVQLHDKWTDTLRINGDRTVAKVTGISNKWRSGRYYPFLLRPHIVNTYLYSSIWYKASVLNYRFGDMEKLQQRGNHYIYNDSFLRPEKVVNYLPKDRAGLATVHIKSKCNALFIKNFLSEATSGHNCYAQGVLRRYCFDEDICPVPLKPPFLNSNMIQLIKLVLSSGEFLSSKQIYKVLLKEEFQLTKDFRLKIQEENDKVDLQRASMVFTSKFISLAVRSQVFWFFHKLIYFEPEEGKVKNKTAFCKLCDEPYIERAHIYFKCSKLFGIGRDFLKILRVLEPDYTEEEVMYLTRVDSSLPQGSWLIANTIYFISCNREKCDAARYKAFLNTELNTLRYSKHVDLETLGSFEVLVDLLGNMDEIIEELN